MEAKDNINIMRTLTIKLNNCGSDGTKRIEGSTEKTEVAGLVKTLFSTVTGGHLSGHFEYFGLFKGQMM